MANPTLRFKRGSQSAFASVGLQTGEPSFITDESNFFIGFDGTNSNNKFFGSSRYWRKETTTVGGGVNLYGSHAVGVGGTAITLAAPDSVGTAVTFTFPGIQGAVSSVLTNNGSGILSWSSGSANPIFTGIASFTDTTDNTLGDANTGAVQIDGGLGINKNLTVGANLNVQGYSEFVGVVTFRGGTINIGDSNTDNINIGGEFISNLVANDDATYDIGIGTQRWRNAAFSGIVTATTFVGALTGTATSTTNIPNLTGAITSANTVTSLGSFTSANLATALTDETGSGSAVFATSPTLVTPVLGAANATSIVVSGISTFTGAIDANGGADISGGETILSSATVSDLTSGRVVLAGTSGALEDSANLTFGAGGLIVGANGLNVIGVSTFSTDLIVGGDLQITGNDIKSSTGAVAITLAANDVTVADDLTVGGNLFVNGSTTQVNTTALTIEDRTIDLGIVNGAAPATNTTWDLGVLFNYYSSAVAKKSAVIWEHVDARFKFASVLSSDTDGTDVNTPQLTVTTFAPIEIGELWVNSACTSGTQQVIGCSGGELQLQNIVIDGGVF